MPITLDEISYSLDLTKKLKSKNITGGNRIKATEAVGNYLLTQLFSDTQQAKSPVTGKAFKALKPEYKAFKKSKGKGTKANLSLFEKMLPNLKVEPLVNSVKLEITKTLEKEKAFNHITGDTLPKRPFLPDDKGKKVEPKLKGADQFRTTIVRGIDDILESFADGN